MHRLSTEDTYSLSPDLGVVTVLKDVKVGPTVVS